MLVTALVRLGAKHVCASVRVSHSELSSISGAALAEFLGKKWNSKWGDPSKPIPHKAEYNAAKACMGHHPKHWTPKAHF